MKVLHFSLKPCHCNKVTWEKKENLLLPVFFYFWFIKQHALEAVAVNKVLDLQIWNLERTCWKKFPKQDWFQRSLQSWLAFNLGLLSLHQNLALPFFFFQRKAQSDIFLTLTINFHEKQDESFHKQHYLMCWICIASSWGMWCNDAWTTLYISIIKSLLTKNSKVNDFFLKFLLEKFWRTGAVAVIIISFCF